jgi:hypothetical protein
LGNQLLALRAELAAPVVDVLGPLGKLVGAEHAGLVQVGQASPLRPGGFDAAS